MSDDLILPLYTGIGYERLVEGNALCGHEATHSILDYTHHYYPSSGAWIAFTERLTIGIPQKGFRRCLLCLSHDDYALSVLGSL